MLRGSQFLKTFILINDQLTWTNFSKIHIGLSFAPFFPDKITLNFYHAFSIYEARIPLLKCSRVGHVFDIDTLGHMFDTCLTLLIRCLIQRLFCWLEHLSRHLCTIGTLEKT